MKLARYLLWPFGLLYGMVVRLRNHLYNIEYKKAFHFDTHVINVGNLAAGGTGKTPLVEYLIRLLKQNNQVVTLSRGYGRKTSGFIIADNSSTSQQIGDEPMQYFLKYKDKIQVCVGEERALAIPEILFNFPETDTIILDDAYQHRSVIPDLNILVTDYKSPFYQDHILPVGNLREPRKGAERADILVVSKCPPDLSVEEQKMISEKLLTFIKPSTPIFFASIKHLSPKKIFEVSDTKFSSNLVLFSGIGKPRYLEEFIRSKFNLAKHISFNDHHQYQYKDILKIATDFNKLPYSEKCILTTEKDMVKIKELPFVELKDLPLFYLPIEMEIINQPDSFDEMVIHSFIKAQNVSDSKGV